MSEDRITDFGSMITELMRGRNLTRSEACEMFRQMLMNEQPELHQGAFLGNDR